MKKNLSVWLGLLWIGGMGVSAALVGCGGPDLPDDNGPATPACEPSETSSRPCGECGEQHRACVEGQWSEWSECSSCSDTDAGTDAGPDASTSSGSGSGAGGGPVQPDECGAGEQSTRPCGNCGTQSRSCVDGTWGSWTACSGEGECAPGATDSQACGTDVGACSAGTQSRSCSAECSWGAWGACGGPYAGPQPEVCGDQADNDCNGLADEGCTCSPAAKGAPGSFAVSEAITKLVADPARCFVYGLGSSSPAGIIVIDTGSKQELKKIPLPQAASDIDISPDGSKLVAAHDATHAISIIDLSTLTVKSTISVSSDPYAVEVSNAGIAYYAELDQWVALRRVDLGVGSSSDQALESFGVYQADVELSKDGVFLYAGEAGLSGSALRKYNVTGAKAQLVDESNWDDGYGFPYPSRHVYLSPSGQHIYYAGYQLDAAQLSFVRGKTGERVFAEDAAGTFAVGETAVWDAGLVRKVASLPTKASAAVLTSSDREVWYYGASDGRMHYASVDDFVFGVSLGQREIPPQPITNYTFAALVPDPVRPLLYGLDKIHELVVTIDTTTMAPTGAIVVGSAPSDIDVDPAGGSLFVGHLGVLAVARIDLAAGKFDKFIPTKRVPYEVEALNGSRLAVIDEDQWTTPTIIDSSTGAELASASWGAYEGALATTSDGASLFVGESGLSGSNITRYSVVSGTLMQVSKSTYNNGYGFPYAQHSVVAVPDGSGVFYAGYLLDGNNLSILKYPLADKILSVTPDGRLATSATKVYRVSDGAALGNLTPSAGVQAISPDSKTLYVLTGSGVGKVDLSGY